MQFKQVLLMCSALITIGYSFPSGSKNETTPSTLQMTAASILHTKEKSPLVLITEEENPKSDSVVVQFVYKSNGGNSIVESVDKDKYKYDIDPPGYNEKLEPLSNLNGKEKSTRVTFENKPSHEKSNEQKLPPVPEVQTGSLIPEEISPLSQKWPKYIFDVFNPIQPFPEIQFGKTNQINRERILRENVDAYLPYYGKEKKELFNVAGPQLSPLSIYDREFNVPIFG